MREFIHKKEKFMSSKLLEEASKISIFSEGKTYSKIYEPVIKELISMNCPVRYYTMDKKDPILSVKTDYIGKGVWAFFKISNLRANILLTTTPNIGTKGYPVRKSPYVKSLIHIWHSFGDFTYSSYHKYSLDSFDEVLLAGEYMEKQIRYIEKLRNLPKKKLIVCGVTYLEQLIKEIPANTKTNSEIKTIMIAPSWDKKSLFTYYNLDFVKKLHEAGYRIIIRPHPQTIKSESKKLNSMKNELKDLKNLIWDCGQNEENYFIQSDILISDKSSVRLDFRVLYNKPVITLDTPNVDLEDYEYDDLKDLLKDSPMDDEIGAKVSSDNIGDIVNIVNDCIKNQREEQTDFIKNKYAANFGNASKIIAKYLIERKKELDLK